MLESVVANLLNKLLGGYVDNLETNQLRIGIWRGDVALKNLQLRKDALDGLHLPIDISKGEIKNLTLTIPWSNLRGQPVKLLIEGLDLECNLKLDHNLSEEDEKKEFLRSQAQKMKELNELELIMSSSYYQDDSNSENNTFYGQLVTKIIDNLQVTIKDIHLKYVDDSSNPIRNFSAGIILRSLSMVSTNEEWSPTFIQTQGDSMFKLISLDNLFIYWDNNIDMVNISSKLSTVSISLDSTDTDRDLNPNIHQAIINPISGTAKLLINNSEKNKTKITLSLNFDQFAVTLDEYQYQDVLLLAANLHSFQTRAKYRKFLPPIDVTPLKNPRPWLEFALKSVLYEVKEKRDRWVWENIKNKCNMRRAYIRLYILSKTKSKLSESDTDSLTEIEQSLSFDELKLFRQLAIPAIRKYNLNHKDKRPETASENPSDSNGTANQSGWVGGWVQWASGTNQPEQESDDPIITEEEINDLISALESSDVGDDSYELISDGTVFQADIVLGKGLLELKSVIDEKYHTIISAVGSSVKADLFQLAKNMVLDLTVEDFRVDDGTVLDSEFPQMIKMRNLETSDLLDSVPFLKIKYEQNPIDGHADSLAHITAQGLDIVFNPAAIQEVLRFFKPPSESAISIQALVEATSRSMAGLQDLTKSSLEYAIQTHKRFDLKVDFQAPVFIFPSNVCNKNSFVTVLDLGHLVISSDFVSSDLIKKISNNSGSFLNETSQSDLDDLIFDWLSIKLEKTQLITGPTFSACIDTISNQKTNIKLHVVDRVELNFRLGICILADRPISIPQIMIDGHLPNLQVLFSDKKYSMLMKTVDIITTAFVEQNSQVDMISANKTKEKSKSKTPLLNIFLKKDHLQPLDGSITNKSGPFSLSNLAPRILSDSEISFPSSSLKTEPQFITSGTIGTNFVSGFSRNLSNSRKPSLKSISTEKNKQKTNVSDGGDSDDIDSDSDQFFDTTDDVFYDSTLEPTANIGKPSSDQNTSNEPKTQDPDQAALSLNFLVDNLTVILYESNSNSEADDSPIANAVVKQFKLEVNNRTFDMNVGIIIHEVTIEDLMTKYSVNTSPFSNKPNYILYSSTSRSNSTADKSILPQEKHLVSINYKRTQIGHPSLQPGLNTVGQKIDIDISAIHFTLIRKTVLKLYNFILTTFAGGNNKPATIEQVNHESDGSAVPPIFLSSITDKKISIDKSDATSKNTSSEIESDNLNLQDSKDSKNPDIESSSDIIDNSKVCSNDLDDAIWLQRALETLKVDVSLKGIDLDICDDSGRSIALLEINMGTAFVTISKEMSVDAKIGELSLIDRHNIDQAAISVSDYDEYLQQRKIISIKGQELLDFSYKTFNSSMPQYPGYDALISLNVGTMHLVFAQAPIKRLICFAEKFAVMHVFFEKTRNDIAIGATQITETVVQGSARTKINLMLSSPIISFFQDGKMPFEQISSYNSSNNNYILAHLGQLSITNEFVKAVETKKYSIEVNHFKITLENINISSHFFYYFSCDKKSIEQSLDILENVTLDAELSIVLGGRNSQSILPETKVTSIVSQLCMKLTLQQYCFFMQMLNVISQTFSGSNSAESLDLDLFFEESLTIKFASSLNLGGLDKDFNKSCAEDKQQSTPGLEKTHNTQDQSQRYSPAVNDNTRNDLIEIPSLDFVLTLPKIQLEIYNGDPDITIDLKKFTLTRMDLIDFQVKFRKKFDDSSIFELSLGSIRAYDTRINSKNYYTEFIGPRDCSIFLKKHDVVSRESPVLFSENSHNIESSSPKLDSEEDVSGDSEINLNKPQILIQFDMEPLNPTVIRGTLNSPRIVFAPDHVYHQIKFFLAPFANSPVPKSDSAPEDNSLDENAQQPILTTGDEEDKKSIDDAQEQTFVLKIDILKPELIFLADPKSASSQALILSIKELGLEMHKHITCTIDDMNMILCQMDQRVATSRSIIDPISIVSSYIQESTTHQIARTNSSITNNQIDISVDVSLLTLKLGFVDIEIILSIINQLNSLMAKIGNQSKSQDTNKLVSESHSNSANTLASQDSVNMMKDDNQLGISPSDTSYKSPELSPKLSSQTDDDDNSNKIFNEKMVITFGGLRAIVIHDKLNLPVLNMTFDQFSVTAADWSTSLIVSSNMALQVTHFNFHNSRWEPLVEMWQFSVNLCNEEMCLAIPKNVQHLKKTVSYFVRMSIESKERLEINASHSSIESLLDLMDRLGAINSDPNLSQNLYNSESATNDNNDPSKKSTHLDKSGGHVKNDLEENKNYPDTSLTNSPGMHTISQASNVDTTQGKSNTSPLEENSQSIDILNYVGKSENSIDIDNSQDEVFSKGQKDPYLIINQTGLDCYIWADTQNSINSNTNNQLKPTLLKDGGSLSWCFQNAKSKRDSLTERGSQLGLQFANGIWEWTRRIEVGVEGVKNYKLSPEVDGIDYILAVEVWVDSTQLVKKVLLRSTLVVENKTIIPIDICMVDYKDKIRSEPIKIKPNESTPLPLMLCHQYAFKARPEVAFGYKWSDSSIYWRDFLATKTTHVLTCLPLSTLATSMPPFNINFCSTYDNNGEKIFQHPLMKIIISAPLEIENLIPYPIQFRIVDNTDNNNWSNVLESGEISSVHSIKQNHLVLMSIRIPEANYDKCDGCVIETNNSDDYPIENEIVMYDQSGNKLNLKVNRSTVKYTNGSYSRISIISPYILINRTSLPVIFQSKSFLKGASSIAVDKALESSTGYIECKPGLDSNKIMNYNDEQLSWMDILKINTEIKPLMFSCDGYEIRSTVLMKAGISEWSKPISLDTVGYSAEVKIPVKRMAENVYSKSIFSSLVPSADKKSDDKFNLHLGIQINPGIGRFSNTKFVVFSPRFIIKNNSGLSLYFKDMDNLEPLSLEPGQIVPIPYLSAVEDIRLSLSINVASIYQTLEFTNKYLKNRDGFDISNPLWSSPFLINQIGKIYIRLPKPQSLAIYEAAPPNDSDGFSVDTNPVKLNSVPLELTSILFEVNIVMENECIFIIINREIGEWPYRIDNWTGFDITFWQASLKIEGGQQILTRAEPLSKSNSTKRLSNVRSHRLSLVNSYNSRKASIESESCHIKKYTVLGYHSMPYTWDFPDLLTRHIYISICGQARKIPIQEIGFRTSFYVYLNPNENSQISYRNRIIIAVEVVAQGSQQVLKIISNDLKQKNQSLEVPNSKLSTQMSPDLSNIVSARNTPNINNKSPYFQPTDNVGLSIDSDNMYAQSVYSSSTGHGDLVERNGLDDVMTFMFELSLEKGIGISLISKDIEEIMYASFSGVDLKIQESPQTTSLTLQIQWLQVDNQLYGAIYPIVLYPTNFVRRKDSDIERSNSSVSRNSERQHINVDSKIKPIFQLAIVRSKADYSNTYKNNYVLHKESINQTKNHLKYVSILIQELSIKLDEDFLLSLLDFSIFNAANKATEDKNSKGEKKQNSGEVNQGWLSMFNDVKIDFENLFLPSNYNFNSPVLLDCNFLANISDATRTTQSIPIPQFTINKEEEFFFDLLMLQPIKLNISFLRTEKLSDKSGNSTSSLTSTSSEYFNPIEYIVNVLTMVIGNVNDVPIYFNALILENAKVSTAGLNDRLVTFYKNEFMSQLFKVVGSADVLGNPVGLFNNISSGVIDIFYEPYQGIMMSDRPQDFGRGLAKGAASFVKKTVYGFSDSMSRFTDSVGKGLSAATLDTEFQSQRRMQKIRNKPQHAFSGVSKGAEALARSLQSGITGVVMQPITGAEKHGVGGFFAGVGKGLVGAVTKPVAGLFDMASNISEGIKNTTSIFEPTEFDRQRLPRYINKMKVIEPYDKEKSRGLNWMRELKKGKYAYDNYLAHLELENSDLVVMLTYQRIILFKKFRSRMLSGSQSAASSSRISLYDASIEWEVKIRDLHSVVLEATGIGLKLPPSNSKDKIIKSDYRLFSGSVTSITSHRNSQIGNTITSKNRDSIMSKMSLSNNDPVSNTGLFIPISNEATRKWFYMNIEEAIKEIIDSI
ncbi:hypothetical protein BB561_002601 [Smittium simulii]|uniref:Vacuolar protein sorting-associated protein n=1 Tax=Smittium simulii TaxID=133385 RepID=A0A2T9YPT1_9FUNG|nr:hypothetical protein BB561_002601 [Smittium simulii]